LKSDLLALGVFEALAHRGWWGLRLLSHDFEPQLGQHLEALGLHTRWKLVWPENASGQSTGGDADQGLGGVALSVVDGVVGGGEVGGL
jgi:hypothetical protein